MTSECEKCGRGFDTKRGLGTHRGRTHGDILDDEEELRRLYWEEGLSIPEIAELKGCSNTTVHNRMVEFEISRREKGGRNLHAGYRTTLDGYKKWQGYNGHEKAERVTVHQLLACMNHDPHEVFAPNTNVHHGANNHPYLPPVELPWANWEGNLEIMTVSEHRKHHHLNPRWKPNTEPDKPESPEPVEPQKGVMDF